MFLKYFVESAGEPEKQRKLKRSNHSTKQDRKIKMKTHRDKQESIPSSHSKPSTPGKEINKRKRKVYSHLPPLSFKLEPYSPEPSTSSNNEESFDNKDPSNVEIQK